MLLVVGLVAAAGREVEAQVNALVGRVAADAPAGTSYSDVPGLSWYVAANTNYAFSCRIAYTVTGGAIPTQAELFLSVNGPASPAALRYAVTTATTATSAAFVSQTAEDTDPNNSNSGGPTALPAVIQGTIENGTTAGPFAIRMRTNSAGGSIANVLRGSFCTVSRQ